jgi:hypothetical protein
MATPGDIMICMADEIWEKIPPWRILKIIRNAWRWRQMSRGLDRGINALAKRIEDERP